MSKRIISVLVLLLMVFNMTAYAGVNQYPELDNLIETSQHEKVEAFIRNDTTNNVTQTVGTTLEIDENTVIGPAYPEVLGHGGEGFNQYDVVCLNPDGTVSDEYQKLCDEEFYDAPVARFGGHNSNFVNLMDHIGPLSERKTSAFILQGEDLRMFHTEAGKEMFLTTTMTPGTCGTVEFIKAMLAQNPNMQFIFCLTLTNGTKEDAANFVRFCLDDPSESEWGKLRADNGLDKLNILAIELGNEYYTNKTSYGYEATTERCDWYIKYFKEFTDEIHKYHPEIETSPCLMCDYLDPDPNGLIRNWWNEKIIRELGPDMKYYSTHLYYGGYEPAYCTNGYKYMENYIKELYGENHGKQLLVTEHSKWMSQTQFSTAATLESALSTAQYLNTLYGWNDLIRAATYYCFTSESMWALMRRNYDGSLTISGPGKMYGVYLDGIGDRVIKTTSIPKDDTELCDKTSTKARFSAQAFAEGDKTLKVILTNRLEDTTVDVDFNFLKNKYTLKEETVFTAPNSLSFVYNANTTDVFKTTTTKKNEANFTNYLMPNKSMVVLTLEANGSIPQVGGDVGETDEPVYEGEEMFSDITYHWAKNEISLLAQEKALSGTDKGIYSPDKKISRAEFASLLCKFIKPSSSESSLSDVVSNDWYRDYVNTVYNLGYMTCESGKFNPEGELTLKDAVIAIYRICESKKNIDIEDADEIVKDLKSDVLLTDYEKKAFAYCIQNGFLNKFYEVSKIQPANGITRAESAVLVYRLKNHLGLSVITEEE